LSINPCTAYWGLGCETSKDSELTNEQSFLMAWRAQTRKRKSEVRNSLSLSSYDQTSKGQRNKTGHDFLQKLWIRTDTSPKTQAHW